MRDEQRAFISVLGGLINGGSVHLRGGATRKGSSPLLDLLQAGGGGGEELSTGPLAPSSVEHPASRSHARVPGPGLQTHPTLQMVPTATRLC